MEIKSDGVQLRAGTLYLNEVNGMHGLGLGLWTFPFPQPLYLLRGPSGEIAICQFTSQTFADEWLREYDMWKVERVIDKTGSSVHKQRKRTEVSDG